MVDVANKTPWHLWLVGVLSLLWNAFGCYIYTMTMMRDPALMASAPPEMVAALDATPVWADAAWALGVWGALLGSIFLLLRRSWAVPAFVVSLIGLLGTTIWQANAGVPMNVPQAVMIWAIALFLLWYAWTMRKRCVLG